MADVMMRERMFDPFGDDFDHKAALAAVVDALLVVGLAVLLVLALAEFGGTQ